jgi:DNA-binding response OmpR family regulator
MADQAQFDESRGRILVAEDEPHIRRILITMLEAADYEVIPTPDGGAAIACLETDESIDLVLTDLMMPVATGLDVLARLQELEHRKGTPVLVLTAKGQDVDRDAAFALGACDFMTKPFSPKKLIARIDEILHG